MTRDDPHDDVRTFSSEEQAQLTEDLYALVTEVHRGDFISRDVDHRLLRELHHRIFGRVRDHAGRTRSRDWGDEYVTYGPHRSAHRNEVERELARVFELLRRGLANLAENREDPTYDAAAFHWAVWAHAMVIKIHPFEDGNGRTSRVLMNLIFVRLGLRPIAIELVKQEYIELLNSYFVGNDIQLLLDGLLLIAAEQLPPP